MEWQWPTANAGLVQFRDGVFRSVHTSTTLPRLVGIEKHNDGKWWSVADSSQEGVRHRVGGPAVFWCEVGDLHTAWFRLGKLHREDGPADVGIYAQWYLQGERHRVEGPSRGWLPPRWHLEDCEVPLRHWTRRSRRLRWLLPPTLV